jgi:hypothetical protein
MKTFGSIALLDAPTAATVFGMNNGPYRLDHGVDAHAKMKRRPLCAGFERQRINVGFREVSACRTIVAAVFNSTSTIASRKPAYVHRALENGSAFLLGQHSGISRVIGRIRNTASASTSTKMPPRPANHRPEIRIAHAADHNLLSGGRISSIR